MVNTLNEYIVEGEIGKNLDDTLSPLMQNVLRSHELPGLAIGIVAGNEVVYARGFGVKSVETREPVSMTTLFHMASISKPFVATALMQLVERGQVRLDAPIVTYLPYFKLDDNRYGDITVQQMLSHVSGMPDVEDYEWNKPQYDEGALERYARGLSSKKLLSEPGEKFAYSNMAFECLGDVIAKVSGMNFDDYVKRHILNPAGMVDSSFLKPEYLPENWAAPHVRILDSVAWEGYPYNRMHGPSSTLHSNVLEMCNWAITNLQRGSFEGRQILAPSSYDVLWRPWAEVGEGKQVGLSWFLGEYRGEKSVEHGGGDTGFRTNLVMLPDKKAAVVVLCNVIPAPVKDIARSALDILFGCEPTSILPYASLPVCKILREKGLDAAVAQWDVLRSNHPDEYDFSPVGFDTLYNAMSLDKVQEAESIARLCARILPESDLKIIEDEFSTYQSSTAMAILRVIRER
jgi:CubicO group peptidase (beta-lactamase class C family)